MTLLDGDLARKHLSAGLGSPRRTEQNVHRIGFVAAQVTKHRGVAICAQIAPYDAPRKAVRRWWRPTAASCSVYVATPVEVCEARDRKGLYARARAGMMPAFTGVSDPYEPPADADIVVDTTRRTSEEAAESILERLRSEGYLREGDNGLH